MADMGGLAETDLVAGNRFFATVAAPKRCGPWGAQSARRGGFWAAGPIRCPG